ncbi:MAG: clostripain-related cysteine peptidase [Oscillospiraceae bacterium]
MVYMIGSNLETDNGCASSDLSEMFSSEIGGNVNLIVQTGGAKEWHVEGIDPHSVQRWSVTEENIELVDDVGSASMTQSSTLSDFVSFCEKNYPADRYGMIFWDHGGGTVAGYGVDEYYPDKTLMLTDIDEALTDAGVKFDFVGYDACLMATIENAIMLEKHADYLIASEELEPGGGWRYDQWMPAVVENSSIETIELGKKIVDSFIEDSGSSNTLSVVELREIPYTYDKLCKFIDSAKLEIEQRSFREISSARSSARSYNDGQHDSVDIVDLVMRTECEGKEEVVAAVNSCVKYRNNCSVRGSSGLSMYFPYTVIDAYDHVRTDVLNTGVTPEYMSFFDQLLENDESKERRSWREDRAAMWGRHRCHRRSAARPQPQTTIQAQIGIIRRL